MYRDHTKGNSDWGQKDRRKSGSDPVHVQHEDGECGGNDRGRSTAWRDAGCDIIRVAVPTMEAAAAIREIKSRSIFRWLPTFTLTTAWLSQPSRQPERIEIPHQPGQHQGEGG